MNERTTNTTNEHYSIVECEHLRINIAHDGNGYE